MPELCRVCGLPKEICACKAIEKETSQKLRVYSTKKRFNKLVTMVEGLSEEECTRVAKELKHALACGGTHKNGLVVLQGEHSQKVVDYLIKSGYPRDVIKLGRIF